METRILETDRDNADFAALVALLDDDLNGRYGALQKQYDTHNRLDSIRQAVVVYVGGQPAACGAYKALSADAAELKRIFVRPDHRRQGLARLVLGRLERLAAGAGYRVARLETGIAQREAIALYQSAGYRPIENYGPYVGNTNSLCMEKPLR